MKTIEEKWRSKKLAISNLIKPNGEI